MARHYIVWLLLLICIRALADGYMIYPHGVSKPGVYIPNMQPALPTYATQPYTPSPQNIALLAELRPFISQIRIEDIISGLPDKKVITCRPNVPIFTWDKTSYDGFMTAALRAELLKAGIYNEDDGILISGHIVKIDVNTFGKGSWTIEGSFSGVNSEAIKIKYEYPFETSLSATAACSAAAYAFVPALRGFFYSFYHDPGFRTLATPPTQ